MSDLDKFQKAIDLATRAGALEQQLADVKRELASVAGELSEGGQIPAMLQARIARAFSCRRWRDRKR